MSLSQSKLTVGRRRKGGRVELYYLDVRSTGDGSCVPKEKGMEGLSSDTIEGSSPSYSRKEYDEGLCSMSPIQNSFISVVNPREKKG